ncbi:Flp family type IVb pilin [Geodermatophilus marinus]|nr:Flp family type IVb pilin [Geodermatophilus sp. LHW52908]
MGIAAPCQAGSADPDQPARPPQERTVLNPLATLATLVSLAQDRLEREEKGATAVEYGLLVGLIAVAIVATLVLLGPELDRLFDDVLTALQGAGGA